MIKLKEKRNRYIEKATKQSKGITLIALIVTIVVMIVVAGVTINMTVGENGIFTKAVKAKEMQEAAEVKERLELKQLDARLALGGENMTLENYLKYLVDQGMIDESDIEDTVDSNTKTILVDDKYIYSVIKNDDGSITLEYEGKAGKLLPKIKNIEVKPTTNSITVKVDATRVDGGEYIFYIKDIESGKDYVKEGTNKTGEYTFTDLEQNKEFKVKVEVENKNGIAETETNVIRTVTVAELTQADLEFTYNPNDWTKDKIVVTVNAKIELPEGYTLQTSKDMTNWENTTTQEFAENGYMYVRLFDGINGGNYAVGEVTKIDKDAPKITKISATTDSIMFSAIDNASGIVGYAVTTINIEPESFKEIENTKELDNIEIGEKNQNTTYYVWIKDKAGNVSGSKSITTQKQLVEKITLNKTNLTIYSGEKETLTVTILPSNAYNGNVIWTSDNEKVAIVSSTGTVTAKSSGTTTIKVKAADESGISDICVVTVIEKIYLVKEGAEQVGFEEFNIQTHTQEHGYSVIETITTDNRATYQLANLMQLDQYKSIKVDIEVTNFKYNLDYDTAFELLICKDEKPHTGTWYATNCIMHTSQKLSSMERKIYNLNLQNITGTYGIGLRKNASPNTSVLYKLYNLWLEK